MSDKTSPSENPTDAEPALPAAIDMERQTVGEASNALLRMYQYSASLPERTLRSAGAIAGGFVRESANWLVPTAFRNSRSYSIFVQQMLDYVVNDLGGVRRALTSGRELNHDQVFLARKTVGNLLDMTALATFHLSPLTVLAIYSNLAYGSNVYMRELSNRLKEQGIIDVQTTIDGVAELIQAMEQASGHAAAMFDQPPISIEGMHRTIRETEAAIAEIPSARLLPFAEIDQLWRQMELASIEQKASIWDVSGTMSIVALHQLQTLNQGTVASLEIGGNMFHQDIVRHYWTALRAIERDGLLPTLSRASEPYLETVWHNFAMDRKTWTEQLLSGELLKWGWSQLTWPRLAWPEAKSN
jgi:hypothetical protein